MGKKNRGKTKKRTSIKGKKFKSDDIFADIPIEFRESMRRASEGFELRRKLEAKGYREMWGYYEEKEK